MTVLRDRLRDPRLRLRIGLVSLILASLASWLVRRNVLPWPDVADFATGTLYGIAIAFLLLSLRSGPWYHERG